MRLLLDTHVVLWWLAADPRLGDDVKDLIRTEPDVFVSPVTTWEVAIKQAQGKLGPANLPERVMGVDFRELPVRSSHAVVAGRLPPIHRDPFDRMLVAQAKCEGLTLATADTAIHKYDVFLLHV